MLGLFSSSNNKDKKDKDEQIAILNQEVKRLRDHIFRQQLYINILHDDINQKHSLIMQLKKLIQEQNAESERIMKSNSMKLTRYESKKVLEEQKLFEDLENGVRRKLSKRSGSVDSELEELKKNSQVLAAIQKNEEIETKSRANSNSLALKKLSIKKHDSDAPSATVKIPALNKKVILETLENFKDELVTFDSDLKNFAPQVFREFKQFILTKQNYLAQDIYDLIDTSFEALSQIKYFQDKMAEKGKQRYEKLIENLLFEILYPRLFVMNEDTRARNNQLQEKFYVLQNVITFDMLEIPQTLRIPSLYTICEHEMKKLSNYKSPTSKINCFSNCVNNLVDVYYAYEKRKPTSDELFPMLVYLVLHANPDNLRSNAEYIYKYIRKNDLMGENGFLITNLEAVISFLDSVDGRSLNKGILEVKTHRAIAPAF